MKRLSEIVTEYFHVRTSQVCLKYESIFYLHMFDFNQFITTNYCY